MVKSKIYVVQSTTKARLLNDVWKRTVQGYRDIKWLISSLTNPFVNDWSVVCKSALFDSFMHLGNFVSSISLLDFLYQTARGVFQSLVRCSRTSMNLDYWFTNNRGKTRLLTPPHYQNHLSLSPRLHPDTIIQAFVLLWIKYRILSQVW